MPPEFDSTYEERVAMMIHDGHLSEIEARRRAYKICYHRVDMHRGRDGSVTFNHTLVAPGVVKRAAKQEAKPEEPAAQLSFEEFQQQARSRFGYE